MAVKTNRLGYPENFFEINNIILIISGMYQPDETRSIYFKSVYICYCFILHSTGAIFFLCEVIQFSETLKSPRKLVAHIGMLGTHLIGILKVGILFVCRKRIRKVMDQLQDNRFYYDRIDKCDPSEIMLKEKRITSLLAVGVSRFIRST